jgi:hypothetical protein
MPVRSLKAAAPVSSATSSTSLQSFWTAPALPRPPLNDGAEAAATEAMAVASVAESGKERFGLRSLLREGAVEPWSAACSWRELGLGFGERRRSWERSRDLEREVRFLERGVEARDGSGGGGGFVHGVRGRPLEGHRRCGGKGSAGGRFEFRCVSRNRGADGEPRWKGKVSPVGSDAGCSTPELIWVQFLRGFSRPVGTPMPSSLARPSSNRRRPCPEARGCLWR